MTPTKFHSPKRNQAWTRLDAVALALACLLLATVLGPLLAAPPRMSKLAACANNLRIMGQAARIWGNDHGNRNWFRVPIGEGGTFPDGSALDPFGGGVKPGAAWFEWATLSNQLSTPRYLVCPSDPIKRTAINWSFTDTNGGFRNANFRNNALSYILGTDAVDWTPRAVLGGDRHLRFDYVGSGCSAKIINVYTIITSPIFDPLTQWTNNIHGVVGNLLYNDGGVERTSTETLRSSLEYNGGQDDNGIIHFLAP